MSTQFYRQLPDGRETGPFSLEELLASVLLGDLVEDDLVRSENSTLWVSACHIKGLFGNVPVAPAAADSQDAPRVAYEAELEALRNGANERANERATQRGRQRRAAAWWRDHVGWEVLVAVMLVVAGVVYSVWGTPEDVRFPLPARMGGPAQQGHFFFGTGPWSTLEYFLLWCDAVVLIAGLAFGRRILSSDRQ